MYSAEAEMDIEGEDEQLVEQKTTKKTEYQKSCFLKYGYEEIDPYFDLGERSSILLNMVMIEIHCSRFVMA